MSAYRHSFLQPAKKAEHTDGRDRVAAELKKIHRAGPTQADSLQKRGTVRVTDADMLRITLSTAEKRARSFDAEALKSITRLLRKGGNKLSPYTVLGSEPLRKANSAPQSSNAAENHDMPDTGSSDGNEGYQTDVKQKAAQLYRNGDDVIRAIAQDRLSGKDLTSFWE
jgi:hypothetical protein